MDQQSQWHRKQFNSMLVLFRARHGVEGDTVCARRCRKEQAQCAVHAIRLGRNNHFALTGEKSQITDLDDEREAILLEHEAEQAMHMEEGA